MTGTLKWNSNNLVTNKKVFGIYLEYYISTKLK